MQYTVGKDYWFIHCKPKRPDECVNLPPWESLFHRLKITKMKCTEHSEESGETFYKFVSPHQMTWLASCTESTPGRLSVIEPDTDNKSTPFVSMMELKTYLGYLKAYSEKHPGMDQLEREHDLNMYNEITLHLLKMHAVGFGEIIEMA